ncbi:MAG: TIGR03546 family protein [Gammaproteobacteria bacterium]|nr:TIGR03546 family protein [Gammaproteobacteria bacterium]MDH5630146.1 TIGR03546 family protein [Gammaproteobacteria bacterium]
MLAPFTKVIKALNSEQSPAQLAAAISFAAILGLTPLMSLHNLLVLFCVLFFRVNLTLFILAWPLFATFSLLLEPVYHNIGYSILTQPDLKLAFESFYNNIIGRWSNFYYPVVLGSLLIALPVAILGYPFFKWLVNNYRNKWKDKIDQYQIIRFIKASKVWQAYQRFSG